MAHSAEPPSVSIPADHAARGEITSGDGKKLSPRLLWAVIGLHALIALVTFDHLEEDAHIYFRVAANIGNGDGYVFNRGGEHIEVGSSIVWQYVLALHSLLGLDLVVFSKLIGVGLGAMALWLTWRISRRMIQDWRLQVMPALLLCVTLPFYAWNQRGLETPLYVFAILLLADFLLDERLVRYFWLPALLVALARPEGLLVIPGLLGFVWFERKQLRRHAVGAALFLGLLLACSLFRFVYFQDFLPHPFYAKTLDPFWSGHQGAILYFDVTYTWILVVIAAIGLADKRAWDRALVILAILNLPFLWWGFRTLALAEYNRHLVPALPLLYVIVVRGFDRLIVKRRALALPICWSLGGFAVWLAVGAPALGLSVSPRQNLFVEDLRRAADDPRLVVSNLFAVVRERPKASLRQELLGSDSITENGAYLLGDFIRRTYPEGITIVFDEMGCTAWHAGLDKRFIDMWGLTYRPTGFAVYNEQLAQNGSALHAFYRKHADRLLGAFWNAPYREWNRKQAVDHIFDLNPDLIILKEGLVYRKNSDGTLEFNSHDIPGLIAQDPRLAAGYVPRRRPWMRLYERNDMLRSTNRHP